MSASVAPLLLLSLFSVAVAPIWVIEVDDRASSYEPHEPIAINGDGDLERSQMQLPLIDADSKGVRGGSGTEDDPYIIERWTIEYGEGENAIWISGTTRHLVIRDLEIKSTSSEETHWPTIVVQGVKNLKIQNLRFNGELDNVLLVGEAESIHIEDLKLDHHQYVQIDLSKNVQISNLKMSGEGTHILLLSTQGKMSNVSLLQTTSDGARTVENGVKMLMDGIVIGCATDSERPSRIQMADVTVRSYEAGAAVDLLCGSTLTGHTLDIGGSEYGFRIADGRLTLSQTKIHSNGVGVAIEDGSSEAKCHCSITESTFASNGMDIVNGGAREVVAEGNLWDGGRPDPSKIKGPVDYTPWIEVEQQTLSAGDLSLTVMSLVAAALIVVGRFRPSPSSPVRGPRDSARVAAGRSIPRPPALPRRGRGHSR